MTGFDAPFPPPPPPPPRRRVAQPSDLRLGNGAFVSPQDLDFQFVRGGGPGGQHVNKTSTKAQLRVRLERIGGLDVAAKGRLREIAGSLVVGEGDDEALLLSDHSTRSQADNREACLARLKTLVSMAAQRPKVRRKTRPTRASKERRLDAKKREGEKKRQRRSLD
jgi:ribosome-associated protein